MKSEKPNQYVSTSTSRHRSNDSFGGIYSDKDNEIFLRLARSVFEDEDDESVGTRVCAHAHSRASARGRNVEGGDQFQTSFKLTRDVTFGCVSVYEFRSDEAPIMAPLYEYSKEVVRPMVPNAKKTKKSCPKQQRRIQLSKQQFSQLKVPKRTSKNSQELSLDQKPTLPKRSSDQKKLAR